MEGEERLLPESRQQGRDETAQRSPLTVESDGRLWVAALVGVHHEGDLPVLPPHFLRRGREGQVELLVGVELEAPQDPVCQECGWGLGC